MKTARCAASAAANASTITKPSAAARAAHRRHIAHRLPDLRCPSKIIGATKIARNISERKRVEMLIREARDAAEAANSAKDRFLAMLNTQTAHHLTP